MAWQCMGAGPGAGRGRAAVVLLAGGLVTLLLLAGVARQQASTGSRPRPRAARTWASMGLCYSHNTQLHGKVRRGETSWAVASSASAALQAHYPYKEVAVLSLLLWRHHAPQVATLLRIVHTEPGLR